MLCWVRNSQQLVVYKYFVRGTLSPYMYIQILSENMLLKPVSPTSLEFDKIGSFVVNDLGKWRELLVMCLATLHASHTTQHTSTDFLFFCEGPSLFIVKYPRPQTNVTFRVKSSQLQRRKSVPCACDLCVEVMIYGRVKGPHRLPCLLYVKRIETLSHLPYNFL